MTSMPMIFFQILVFKLKLVFVLRAKLNWLSNVFSLHKENTFFPKNVYISVSMLEINSTLTKKLENRLIDNEQ